MQLRPPSISHAPSLCKLTARPAAGFGCGICVSGRLHLLPLGIDRVLLMSLCGTPPGFAFVGQVMCLGLRPSLVNKQFLVCIESQLFPGCASGELDSFPVATETNRHKRRASHSADSLSRRCGRWKPSPVSLGSSQGAGRLAASGGPEGGSVPLPFSSWGRLHALAHSLLLQSLQSRAY